MPTYYDPITLDDLEITPNTTMYLISVSEDLPNSENNTYGIKGISSGLQQFPHDPHTHASKYWPIDTTVLLANQHNEQATLIIFHENKLTPQSLSLSTIKLYFSQGNLGVSAALLTGAMLAFSSTCFMQPNWTEPVAGRRHAP